MIQSSVLPWLWERVGSVSGKRNFGIAEIWRRLRGHPYYRLNEVLDDSAVLNHETLAKVGDWIGRLG